MALDDFPLIPDPEPDLSPEDDLAAAARSLAEAADTPVLEEEPPEPFGKTPLFDFERGRLVRAGSSPVYVSGLRAVEQWCLMALHTARYAHPVVSDDFGMEEPDGLRGHVFEEELASDWGERLEDALLFHDRITAVEDVTVRWFPEHGLLLAEFVAVTDEEETLAVGPLSVRIEQEEGVLA